MWNCLVMRFKIRIRIKLRRDEAGSGSSGEPKYEARVHGSWDLSHLPTFQFDIWILSIYGLLFS